MSGAGRPTVWVLGDPRNRHLGALGRAGPGEARVLMVESRGQRSRLDDLYAHGGRMSSKPSPAGGAHVSRMSDHCKHCDYDPKRRSGEAACPLTTLYWDFLARHRERLAGNGRMRTALAGLRRLDDLDAVRARAEEVLERLEEGAL